MLKPPIASRSAISVECSGNGKVNDSSVKGTMSGQQQQQIDPYSAWPAPPQPPQPPPSTSSTVTGTSELFGSTYAMLSDNASYPDHWAAKQVTQSILFEQPQIQPLVGSSYDPPVRFDPPYAYRASSYMTSAVPALTAAAAQHYYPGARAGGYPGQPSFYAPAMAGVPNTQQLLLAAQAAHAQHQQQQQQLQMQQQQQQQQQQQVVRPEPLRPASDRKNGSHRSTSNSSAETMRHGAGLGSGPGPGSGSGSAATISPSDDISLNSPTLTSSGSAASGTPPLGGDLNSTDLEGSDEERVMCMACRGVYPSRRSLTGHIGRNEKCREIIGRNYLDAVAQGTNPPIPGTDAAIKSGAITTGVDGMSPVCPYCDRFISHYKGNIRRHINQCCKSTEPLKRARVEAGEKHSPKKRVKREVVQHPYPLDFATGEESSSLGGALLGSPKLSSPSSSYYGAGSSEMCSPADFSSGAYEPYAVNGQEDQSPPETAILQDAYICEDCDFVTVYKGNMKRHLNTCHPLPESKKWDTKLEGMRASNMGISGDRLQERLAAHKANSSRGRKPRKKKENGTTTVTSEESEPLEYKPLIDPETGDIIETDLPTSSVTLEGFSNHNNFPPPPPPPPASQCM